MEIHPACTRLCGWQLLQNRSSHVQLWQAVWLAQALLFGNQTAVSLGTVFHRDSFVNQVESGNYSHHAGIFGSETLDLAGKVVQAKRKKKIVPGSCPRTCSSPSRVTGHKTVACSFNIQALLLPKKPIAAKSIVSKPNYDKRIMSDFRSSSGR